MPKTDEQIADSTLVLHKKGLSTLLPYNAGQPPFGGQPLYRGEGVSDDYTTTIPNSFGIDPMSAAAGQRSISFAFWCEPKNNTAAAAVPNNYGGGSVLFWLEHASAGNQKYVFYIKNSQFKIYIQDGAGGSNAHTSTHDNFFGADSNGQNTYTRTHIAIVHKHETDTLLLYKDGALHQAEYGGHSTKSPFEPGHAVGYVSYGGATKYGGSTVGSWGHKYMFEGDMEDIRVYDGKTLTLAEIEYIVFGPPNNLPTITGDNAVSIVQNVTYTFNVAHFNFSDSDAGDALNKIQVVSTATGLKLNETQLQNTNEATAAQISADNLTFTSGTVGDHTFTWKVHDGEDYSDGMGTMTITVVSANNPPTITEPTTVATTETVPYIFGVDDFKFTDDDSGDTLTKIKVVTTTQGLQLNGPFGELGAGAEVTATEINENRLKFVNVATPGTNTFTWRVHDGEDWSTAPQTMTIQTTILSAATIANINALSSPNNYNVSTIVTGWAGLPAVRKRRKRHAILKKIFQKFSSKNFMAKRAELGLHANIIRTKIKVFKTGETIDIGADGNIGSAQDTGWYGLITDLNETINIKTRSGKTINVKVTTAATSGTPAQYAVTHNGSAVLRPDGGSWEDGDYGTFYGERLYFGGVGGDGGINPPKRSVAKADVAELTAALDSAVTTEDAHHLVVVSTNKVLSTTQFKQMFYSRGDDFFQIANVYECPDSCNSIHSSVWGIDYDDPHVTGLVTMGGDRLAVGDATGGYSLKAQNCFNFNKLGGRENDPDGCAWAYSYVHDQSRNFYAQHEVMGYLEKDTCVKRDFWTPCSRMSIEDQLYGLAFASETDQDLCMKTTCARRWSEVEDALAESCAAADYKIDRVNYTMKIDEVKGTGTGATFLTASEVLQIKAWDNTIMFTYTPASNVSVSQAVAAINLGTDLTNVPTGWSATASPGAGGGSGTTINLSGPSPFSSGSSYVPPGQYPLYLDQTNSTGAHADNFTDAALAVPSLSLLDGGHVDLYINVRVTNGHPKALDTILRVRFTVAYVSGNAFYEPSALHTWNTRASAAAAGVIQSGVVGDAPEGGKEQSEDTSVVT